MKTRFKKGDIVTTFLNKEVYAEEFMVSKLTSPDKVAFPSMQPVVELIHTSQCQTLIILESELYENFELVRE